MAAGMDVARLNFSHGNREDHREKIRRIRDSLPRLQHVVVVDASADRLKGDEIAFDLESVELPEKIALADADVETPSVLHYTSGTTGQPKGALHVHGSIVAQSISAKYVLDLRPDDLYWCTADPGWVTGTSYGIIGPWSLGVGQLIYDGGFSAERWYELLEKHGVTVWYSAPTAIRLLMKEGAEPVRRHDLSKLRHLCSVGEPLNPEVIRAWESATGLPIRDGYGQTETILLVANYPGLPIKPGAMGLPMPGHRVEVIDERGEPAPAGEVGDIALHGQPPSLFRGYWKDDLATARTRRGEWYVTGDRAYRDEDGYFWFVGRDDDVIISAGYRIGPFEVESALVEHPDVIEAAAVAAPDRDRGHVVKAYVVVRDGVRADVALARRLQDHVKVVTAPYKYPRQIEFVTELPKTVSGKIRRVELRQRAAQQYSG